MRRRRRLAFASETVDVPAVNVTSRLSLTSQARLLLICAAAMLAASFDARAASGKLQFDSAGVARSAFLVEHERLKRGARPTLIVLHGGSGSGLRTRRTLGLEDVIRSQGVVVVYPDAIGGRWDLSEPGSKRDTQMMRDLVRKLVDDRIADRRRIYLLGLSTGGIFALRLACQNADLFAGVGALIAALPEAQAATCKPAKPLPFLMLAGTANPYLPYGGGTANLRDFKGNVASVEATLAPFKAAAGCGDLAASAAMPDRDAADQSRVFIDTYKDCKVPLELIRVEGGGHTIPGRWRGPTDRGLAPGIHNNDVDASRLIWDFFKRAGA